MSSEPETTRIVRSWLDEGVTELPDRVLDAVLDQVPATPQRRATWWPARRFSTMNMSIKVGLVAAALVAAVLVGINVLGAPSNLGGPGPSLAPEPTVETTPSPEPEPSVAAGLPEGPHVLLGTSSGGVGMTVTIAAPNWDGDVSGGVLVHDDNVDPPAGAGMIMFAGPEYDYYVYGDPCEWSTTAPDAPATTVDEFLDALASQASRQASAPEDITVDGYAGKKMILTMVEGVAFDDCDEGYFALFGQSGGTSRDDLSRYSQGPGQIEEVWVVDVDGRIVVMDGVYYADTPQDVVAELQAILASATFELP